MRLNCDYWFIMLYVNDFGNVGFFCDDVGLMFVLVVKI